MHLTGIASAMPDPVTKPVAPYKVDTSRGEVRGDVSMQWFSRPADQRFDTLYDLRDFKRRAFESSIQSRVSTADVQFIAPVPRTKDDLHKLTVGIDKVRIAGSDVVRSIEVAPTHWSFGQLARLAKAPPKFLRELPSSLTADILGWRMRPANREREEIKLYAGPSDLTHFPMEGGQLYAATGPDYGRIPDHEVVDALIQVAGSGKGDEGHRWKAPGRLDWSAGTYDPEAIGPAADRTFYASDRDLFCFLVDDRNPIEVGKTAKGDPDLMFRGFYVQNSEVGSRSLLLAAFYLRGVCMNRNLWGVEGFQEVRIRHTAQAPDRWLREVQPALASYADGSSQRLIDGVHKAKAAVMAADDAEALEFLTQRAFSSQAAKRIAEISLAEEDRPLRTAWDFAQGMTAYARDLPNTDDRLEVEVAAKRILDRVAA